MRGVTPQQLLQLALLRSLGLPGVTLLRNTSKVASALRPPACLD